MELRIPDFALSEETADYCVSLASRIFSGVTRAHYYEYIKRVYKSNGGKWSPGQFVYSLYRGNPDIKKINFHGWHMEVIKGKKVRVDDDFELIPAPPLGRSVKNAKNR